jgi:hypothetical protein
VGNSSWRRDSYRHELEKEVAAAWQINPSIAVSVASARGYAWRINLANLEVFLLHQARSLQTEMRLLLVLYIVFANSLESHHSRFEASIVLLLLAQAQAK